MAPHRNPNSADEPAQKKGQGFSRRSNHERDRLKVQSSAIVGWKESQRLAIFDRARMRSGAHRAGVRIEARLRVARVGHRPGREQGPQPPSAGRAATATPLQAGAGAAGGECGVCRRPRRDRGAVRGGRRAHRRRHTEDAGESDGRRRWRRQRRPRGCVADTALAAHTCCCGVLDPSTVLLAAVRIFSFFFPISFFRCVPAVQGMVCLHL
jgi:hypothetical protein